MRNVHSTFRRQGLTGTFAYTIGVLCLTLLLTSCAAWKNATSSDQWVELPPPPGCTNEMQLREWSIVQAGTPITNMMQAADLMLRGHVRSYGPADVVRDVKANQQTGEYSMRIETKQSGTWAGICKGVWSSLSAAGDWLATAVAGAAP